ncbi:MAG: glycosyltransferase family 39 protein [Anaerolineae bacterium]|nr:glycosyltransferase family 39 protein [Anaerolineae bacterium]
MARTVRPTGTERLSLAVLTVAALAIRMARIGFQSLWRDEVDAIRFATQPLSDLMRMFLTPGENGPLYFLALRPWLAVFGDAETGLRSFSAVAGAALVPLMFHLGSRLFGRRAGWLAAGLTAVAPYAVWYSQEGKMYAWVALLAATSFALLWRGLERGPWWAWAGYVLTTALSLFIHYLTALLIPTFALVFLAGLRRWRPRWKAYAASLALVTLPYLAFAAWQVPIPLSGFRTGHPFVPFHRALASVLFGFSEGVRPAAAFWALVPFLLCLLAAWALQTETANEREVAQRGSKSRTPSRDSRLISASACTIWWAVPFLLLFGISLLSPLFVERYLITTLPAFLLLVAAGLDSLLRHARYLGVLTAAAVLAVSVRGVWVQATQPIKPDMRAASQYVCPRLSADDAIVFLIPHAEPVFSRYCARPYTPIPAPYANGGQTETAIRLELEQALRGKREVWLVESEAHLWDERGLVRSALAEGWVQADDRQFTLVRATAYRR